MASPPFSSLSLFTPTITAGLGFENLEAQLMTVPPYAAACTASFPHSVSRHPRGFTWQGIQLQYG